VEYKYRSLFVFKVNHLSTKTLSPVLLTRLFFVFLVFAFVFVSARYADQRRVTSFLILLGIRDARVTVRVRTFQKLHVRLFLIVFGQKHRKMRAGDTHFLISTWRRHPLGERFWYPKRKLEPVKRFWYTSLLWASVYITTVLRGSYVKWRFHGWLLCDSQVF
jgi:hypothetical protein